MCAGQPKRNNTNMKTGASAPTDQGELFEFTSYLTGVRVLIAVAEPSGWGARLANGSSLVRSAATFHIEFNRPFILMSTVSSRYGTVSGMYIANPALI